MATLTVRLYNVRFGDGILISVPDRNEAGEPVTRHILIDVGNVASGEGGENDVFTPVIQDILDVLGGKALDLYVMTHEHLDHVQGLLWADKKAFPNESLAAKLNVQHAWLPASARPDYYDTHPEAKKKLAEATAAYFAIGEFLGTSPEPAPEMLQVLMRNNNRFFQTAATTEGLSHGRTADCVEYLRGLAGGNDTHYVHRSIGNPSDGVAPFDLTNAHNFREARFEIWAPEEDTSDYYGRFRPMALGVTDESPDADPDTEPARTTPTPLRGVDAGAFYNLVHLREGGYIENLLAIDKAANNSSIVFCLEWRGWRLLFPGDAEIRSWKEMNKEGVLSPIHFLKISHHGSHNGTPDADLLNKILPVPKPDDGKERRAAVSTFEDTYSGIPHEETFDELENVHGCKVHKTLGLADGAPLKIEFEG
jgi:beta-lactamase superfamily II metal-dependent hydrolase